MVLFLVYWLWSLLSFGTSLRDAMDMHQLYTSRLKISPTDIHTIEWSEVRQKGSEAGRMSRWFRAACCVPSLLLQLIHFVGMGHGGGASAKHAHNPPTCVL